MVVMVGNNLGEFMNIEMSPKEYDRVLSWDDAKLYCELLFIDGVNDWRMPTLYELGYMYKSENAFNNFDGAYYWTSTYYDNNYVWVMGLGGQEYDFRLSRNYVRAVRSI